MKKILTCIECPNGCQLEAVLENNRVIEVLGYKCPLGEKYAKREIENPERTLSSAVLAIGLEVKMVPVRTTKPLPKTQLLPAMEAIKKIRLTHSVKAGDVIQVNFLALGVDLIATRSVK